MVESDAEVSEDLTAQGFGAEDIGGNGIGHGRQYGIGGTQGLLEFLGRHRLIVFVQLHVVEFFQSILHYFRPAPGHDYFWFAHD